MSWQAILAVLVGLATGGLLFWHWTSGDASGNASRKVLRDALVALRALVLPLLLIVLVGALFDNAHPVAGITAGVVAAAILVPWVRSQEWRGNAARFSLIVGLGTLVVAVLSILALRPLLREDTAFENIGGIPTAIAIGATFLWALAAIARAGGFARTPLRLLATVVALFAGARLLLSTGALGLTWSRDAFPNPGLCLALAGLLLAVCVLAEGFAATDRLPAWAQPFVQPANPAPAPWSWSETAARVGLVLATTSAALLLLAFGLGLWDVDDASTVSSAGLRPAAVEPQPLLGYSDRELALSFLPVLRFDGDALWTPQPVDGYLEQARLTRPGATRNVAEQPTLASLPTQCDRRWVDPCYTLTLDCPAAGPAGDRCPPTQEDHEPRAQPYQDGAVYARVLRAGKPGDEDPYPFRAVGPPAIRSELHALVQYWFFYDYDEWVAPVLGGRIVQRHEGDWEAVTVGLGEQRPLFVAFSEHCGGLWQRWRDAVKVVDTRTPSYAATIPVTGASGAGGSGPRDWDAARAQLTHPVVYVALGSQANYPPAHADRAPDWSTCQGLPGETVSLLSYVWNIRDRTGLDFSWLPGEVKLVDEETPPMSFPGTWGAKDTIQYVTTFDDPERKGGAGPRTPPGQPLWSRPVHRIFCERGWKGDAARAKDWECER